MPPTSFCTHPAPKSCTRVSPFDIVLLNFTFHNMVRSNPTKMFSKFPIINNFKQKHVKCKYDFITTINIKQDDKCSVVDSYEKHYSDQRCCWDKQWSVREEVNADRSSPSSSSWSSQWSSSWSSYPPAKQWSVRRVVNADGSPLNMPSPQSCTGSGPSQSTFETSSWLLTLPLSVTLSCLELLEIAVRTPIRYLWGVLGIV